MNTPKNCPVQSQQQKLTAARNKPNPDLNIFTLNYGVAIKKLTTLIK